MTQHHDTTRSAFTRLGRRTLLRGLLGTGAAAASLAVPASAGAGEHDYTLVLDVACLADTFRFTPSPDPTPPLDSPLYGATFLVEGNIYPGGSLDGRDGFDPRDPGGPTVIGTWLCRGWLMSRDERPHPEVLSTQLYLLPALGEGTAPHAQLVSQGLEGLPVPVTRSVTGGTGPYSGAHGTVIQEQIGGNATGAGPAAVFGAGPNFRFNFHVSRRQHMNG